MNLSQALDYFNIDSLENYTFEQLKIDYKKLAKKYHPDTNNGNHEAFVKLRQSYHIISENLTNLEKTHRRPTYSSSFGRVKKSTVPGTQMNSDLQVQFQILHGETKNSSLEAQKNFQSLWESFKNERELLLQNMDADLTSLKNKRGFLSSLMFWREESMVRKNLNYQIKLNEYQQKLYELDTSYLKKVVKMYSEVLNHLNNIASQESES